MIERNDLSTKYGRRGVRYQLHPKTHWNVLNITGEALITVTAVTVPELRRSGKATADASSKILGFHSNYGFLTATKYTCIRKISKDFM